MGLRSGAIGVEQQLGPARAIVQRYKATVREGIGPLIVGGLQQARQVQLVGADGEVGDPDRRPGLQAQAEDVRAAAARQNIRTLAGV